jgi:hypothetical protein
MKFGVFSGWIWYLLPPCTMSAGRILVLAIVNLVSFYVMAIRTIEMVKSSLSALMCKLTEEL